MKRDLVKIKATSKCLFFFDQETKQIISYSPKIGEFVQEKTWGTFQNAEEAKKVFALRPR